MEKLYPYIVGILIIIVVVLASVLFFSRFTPTDESVMGPDTGMEERYNETGIYREGLQPVIVEVREACREFKEAEGSPLKAYIEDDLEICSNAVNEELCERNYYLFKMLAEDFSNCEDMETEKEKKMCEIMQKKEPEECRKIEEVFSEEDISEQSCLSIVRDNIRECDDDELGPYEKRDCWFGYYLYKSKKIGFETCENLKDFPTKEVINNSDLNVEDYFDFSSAHLNVLAHHCKAFASNNFSVYEDFFEERCELDTVVARVTPIACEIEVKEELRGECKDRIEKLIECLDSDKTLQAKKECIDEYSNRDMFCGEHYGADTEAVEASLDSQGTSKNTPLKRKDLIAKEPQLCVI